MKFKIKSISGEIPSSILKSNLNLYSEAQEHLFLETESFDDLMTIMRKSGHEIIMTPRGYTVNYVDDNGVAHVIPEFHTIEIYDDYRE